MPPNSTSPTANVSFKKVKAHVGIDGNEMADKLANQGAMSAEVAPRDFEAATRANERKLREKGLQKVEVEFEVDLGDLWTDEELDAMGKSQNFS
jgi:ribonuclease HI